MTITQADFFGREALLDRLTDGVKATSRPVVFLVGSAVTAAATKDAPGVPNVSGVIELIRNEFVDERRAELDLLLEKATNRYQEAFSFLLSRRGQNVVNDIVKRAVWMARKTPLGGDEPSAYTPTSNTDEATCRSFDEDHLSWHLTPAVSSLGQLTVAEPELFGHCALTTNFDPLIEISVRAAGGTSYRTVVHRDGDLGQTAAAGCHVIHLHGYWHGTDTLHTPRQLTQDRPRLKASLAHILRAKTLVVCGYGGWDDVFTKTLMELIQDDRETTEVIWTFFGDGCSADSRLLSGLQAGLDRGVVTLYDGIDCHDFLPALRNAWLPAHAISETAPATINTANTTSPLLAETPPLRPISSGTDRRLIFDGRDQDRPPLVEYYVGRSGEANELDNSEARVVFLTGIGGEGKSALAANYLARHRTDGRYDHLIWRDCKEESERFEAQIISIVHVLGGRQASIGELSERPIDDLFELFVKEAEHLSLLLVFDNVDHYVDLERGALVGSAAKFVNRLLQSQLKCRVLFTCRPTVSTQDKHSLELRLRGIDLSSTEELFKLREVSAPRDEIARAHELTRGHAFWLDLIAAQISRNPDGPQLNELLDTVAQGEAGLPVATLQSIWDALKERERLVLRGLAEAVRPVTAAQLSDYLSTHIKFNQISKAIRYLRGINLIVVKLQEGQIEVLELHPIIRAFVRMTFAPAEQRSFIDSILKSYLAFLGIHRSELSKRPRAGIIDRWIEAAEVSIQAGRYDQAFEYLHDVEKHFQSTGHTLNFVRVANTLVYASDWSEETLPKHFDSVFTSLINAVASMGREHQCIPLMERYRETIPHKNARYINYCNMMCAYYWVKQDYFTAIKWGVDGVDLKRTSNVDTQFDASHNLALAQRDSGAIDAALAFFLKGHDLNRIVKDEVSESALDGAFYGNVGRCLHLMGQIQQAISCYQKSAREIEEEVTAASLANKGYIRQWVGELAYSKGEKYLASACFSAAILCWELIAPPKADNLERRLRNTLGYEGLAAVPRDSAERTFVNWVRDGHSDH